MVNMPRKALNGNLSSISNIESFFALKVFTLSKTHLPGDAFLGSNNLLKLYSKSYAVTFLFLSFG